MYNILEIDANVISVARVSSLYNLQPRTARTNLIQGQAQRPQRFLRCFIMLNYELRVSIYAALAYPKRQRSSRQKGFSLELLVHEGSQLWLCATTTTTTNTQRNESARNGHGGLANLPLPPNSPLRPAILVDSRAGDQQTVVIRKARVVMSGLVLSDTRHPWYFQAFVLTLTSVFMLEHPGTI